MKNFFKVMLVFLLWSENAYSETVQGKAENTPAPPSPVHVSVPHSARTKGNFLDAALDFLFVRFFKSYKDLEINYDFFEINKERDLVFTNFKVKSSHADASGTVVAQKVVFDFSDFLKTLKAQKASTSKIGFEKISGNLKVTDRVKKSAKNPSGKIFRNAKFKADRVTLKDVALASWSKKVQTDRLAGEVSGKNISVTLSDPVERYAASAVEVRDLALSAGKVEKVTFSSATVNGKECMDAPSFLKAVRQ